MDSRGEILASSPRAGEEPWSVRALLRHCAQPGDQQRRAVLWVRLAAALEQSADDIATNRHGQLYRETVAGLRAQADLARMVAALDQIDDHTDRSPHTSIVD